jgi:hypothetical protein
MIVHLKLDTLEISTAVIFLHLLFFSVFPSVTMGRSFTGKVKEVNFTLEQAMKAQSGSRGIAVLFL